MLGALVGTAIGGVTAFTGKYASPWVFGWAGFLGGAANIGGKVAAGALGGAIQNAGVGLASNSGKHMVSGKVGLWDDLLAYAGWGALGGGVAKGSSLLFKGLGTVPDWMNADELANPRDIAVSVGYKTGTKALDKTALATQDRKATGQSEVLTDFARGKNCFSNSSYRKLVEHIPL